tara:strand:- start:46492 stop:46884 length:393 start_codon:yes stop_codon:yes gene_type:complete
MFEFEIVINFPDGKPDEAAVLDALFQAGLDDTIVGTGRSDRIALGFTRDGPDLEQVLTAAVAQVVAAFPSASVQVLDLAVLGDVRARPKPFAEFAHLQPRRLLLAPVLLAVRTFCTDLMACHDWQPAKRS